MAYSLAIDRGNSAVKVAVYEGSGLIDTVTASRFDAQLLRDLRTRYGIAEAAVYATVGAHESSDLRLLSHAARRLLRVTSETPLPIAVDYAPTLGVDRIAAAVGAADLFPETPLLVVDAGTAVTYDVVSDEGRFIGGNIAPGLKMRLDALHRYTAALPRPEIPESIDPSRPFGTDTPSAMINGAVFGMVGAIEGYLRRLPADTRVVMTGGSARLLASVADFPVTVDEHLVTNGLNCILRYNEDSTSGADSADAHSRLLAGRD